VAGAAAIPRRLGAEYLRRAHCAQRRRDYVRRDAREGPHAELDETLPSDADAPEHETSASSSAASSRTRSAPLPLGQKQVVVLHLEDFDHAQIAATLGIGGGRRRGPADTSAPSARRDAH